MICAEIADPRVVRDSCLRTLRPLIRLASRPVGDEVAPFSAARHSGIPSTRAIVTPRTFGCGCAALSVVRFAFPNSASLFGRIDPTTDFRRVSIAELRLAKSLAIEVNPRGAELAASFVFQFLARASVYSAGTVVTQQKGLGGVR